ncbi:hypothetical protein LNQ49_17990 [Flavobacterium sp. F-65]|uniref:Uncharacterized protein n=1 Tax=Flavobacterium pisciphilum TaxID=2893755 RepID=A0ABS8N066_9FLAO|nr:hypothetical protein [Flavobacterium sp. F-65]MCC9073470.1 hypothetical protein [Flavobacterium sp. F-65]
MESKNKILKLSLIIAFVLVLIVTLFFSIKTEQPKKDILNTIQPSTPEKSTLAPEKISETELNFFFQDFIKAFNSNKEKEINKFIDKKDGLVEFVYDGPYPLIIFTNKMEYIEWFESKIHTTVSSEKFPIYLGDTQFEKTGFFYEKYENKFKLTDFNNDYVNLSDTVFKSHSILEEKCNYRARAMDVTGKRIYNFYFSITKENKKLVGLSYDYIEDNIYSNPKIDFIPFDSKKDIENYITKHQKFCDTENESYLDFSKKEFTYWDFKDKPFQFKNYEIGDVEIESKKLKTRKITFYNADVNAEYNNDFAMILSNKGTFTILPMGARPFYEYIICK